MPSPIDFIFLDSYAPSYIKEFVHGDFRRTTPSLGSLLGTEVDILELDVEVASISFAIEPPNSGQLKL